MSSRKTSHPAAPHQTQESSPSDRPALGAVPFEQVLKDEAREILRRRKAAHLPDDATDADDNRDVTELKAVGLSLSGGGIRSGSFCLGFLQAMYRTGLLRHIDYLSTVSGGGYAGSSLSSEVMHPDTMLDWRDVEVRPRSDQCDHHKGGSRRVHRDGTHAVSGASSDAGSPRNGRRDHERVEAQCHPDDLPGPSENANFGLAPLRWDRQPPRVTALINGGAYLRRPIPFFNRWLIGVVLIVIAVGSGLLALVSLAAYLFRCLDSIPVMNLIAALGFHGDSLLAFFPACVALAAWVVAWSISYFRSKERAQGSLAQWVLVVAVALMLMALSALLGTGDISFDYLRDLFGHGTGEAQGFSISWLLQLLIPPSLAVAILPYIVPHQFIRSGGRPRNAVEGWVFAIVSRVLLFGVPLFLFGWLAQENISDYNAERLKVHYGAKIPTVYDIVPSDFLDWSDTWDHIEQQATTDPVGWNRLSMKLWGRARGRSGDSKDASPLDRWWKPWNKSYELERNYTLGHRFPLVNRWLEALGYLLLWNEDTEFVQLYENLNEAEKAQKDICKHLLDWTIDLKREPISGIIDRLVDANPELRSTLPDWLLALRPSPIFPIPRPEDLPPPDAPLTRADQRIRRSELENVRRRRAELSALLDWIPPGGKLTFRNWDRLRWQKHHDFDDNQDTWKPALRAEKEKELKNLVFDANGAYLRLKKDIDRLNWDILRAVYHGHFHPKTKVFSRVVLKADQKARMHWFQGALAVFVVAGLLVNMNACSLHGFYKERLASMWIRPYPGVDTAIPLTLLETTGKGAPYHLLGATLNTIKLGTASAKAPEDVFIFSQAYCGSKRTGFLPTARFEAGRYDLASAMALSGAALSPAYFHNPLIWFLMLLTNLRLGQWLSDPAHPIRQGWARRLSEFWGPVPLRLLLGMMLKVRSPAPDGEQADDGPDREPIKSSYFCFVTDGGYIENLGLEQLLLRRCRLIIACDASDDPRSDCCGLMQVLRRVRSEHGIHVHRFKPGEAPEQAKQQGRQELLGLEDLGPQRDKPSGLSPKKEEDRLFANEHFVFGRILYPPRDVSSYSDLDLYRSEKGDPWGPKDLEENHGLLIYVKPTLTGDEDADLIRYWNEHPEFPHDPTMDQFYTPDKFESYRQLGFHIGFELIRRLTELEPSIPRKLLGKKGGSLIKAWGRCLHKAAEDRPKRKGDAARLPNGFYPVYCVDRKSKSMATAASQERPSCPPDHPGEAQATSHGQEAIGAHHE